MVAKIYLYLSIVIYKEYSISRHVRLVKNSFIIGYSKDTLPLFYNDRKCECN